jgi:hypothetical protein
MNLGWSPFTFWLKIEQFWPFEEISIFSHGGHLGNRTALTEYLLKSSSLCLYSSNLGTFWLKIEQFWPFEEITTVPISTKLC